MLKCPTYQACSAACRRLLLFGGLRLKIDRRLPHFERGQTGHSELVRVETLVSFVANKKVQVALALVSSSE